MKNIGKFILNGLMLSCISLILRTVGVAFNAYITSKVGEAGIGLYSLVMSVYGPAMTLAIAGVNLAVSRLVAEELGKNNFISAKEILKKASFYSLISSGSVAIIIISLSDYISNNWLGDSSASGFLRMLALSLPFLALTSASSGYFTAVRRVSRNAAVQIFEQIFKIAITVITLSKSIAYGSMACLAAVIFCSCIADLLSCFLLFLLSRYDLSSLSGQGKKEHGITGRILKITLPVSVSSFLRSGLLALEHILIPKGLKKRGQSYESAMATYGILSGMAMPIIMFPSSFLYSFAGLLVPELAEAKEKNQYKSISKITETTLKTVLIFSIGAAGIIFAFAWDIGMGIYQSESVIDYIKMLAPLIPIMYLDTAVDSVLKGLGEQIWAMKINVADAIISVLAVWILVPIMGISGYILVIIISEMFNFALSIFRLSKITKIKFSLIFNAFMSLLSIIGAVSIVKLFEMLILSTNELNKAAVFLKISSAGVLYCALLMFFGIISKDSFKKMVHKILIEIKKKKEERTKKKRCL